MKKAIISIEIDKRNENAPEIQEIFTKHGCIINVRLGVHDYQGCSASGLVLLVVKGEENDIQTLYNDLNSHPQTKVNMMEI